MRNQLFSPSVSSCGYEVSKGHYVRIEDAELEDLEAEANSSIDLREFIPLEKSTPIYFESSYYDVGTKALISLPLARRHRPRRAGANRLSQKESLVLIS